MTVVLSRSEPLDLRVGPHGYSHGWVKGSDVLDGSWKLTGIQHDKGQCDHCGRDLGKVFQVVHPSGRTANLGSTHAAKATGFNKVQQAADAAAVLAEKQKQRVATEQKLRDGGEGDLIDRLQSMPQTVDVGGSTMASSAQVVLNQLLDGILTPDQVRENMPNASGRSAGVIISRSEPLRLRNWVKWHEEHPYLRHPRRKKAGESAEDYDAAIQRDFAEAEHHFQEGRAAGYGETKASLADGRSLSLAKTEAQAHETKAASYNGIVGRSKDENRKEVVRAIALHAGRAEGMNAAIDEHEHPAPITPPKPTIEPPKPSISKPDGIKPGQTPADESKYLPGSPKYKAFNEGHEQAITSAHINTMSKEDALAKAAEQRNLANRLPTAKGDTRKAQTEGMVAGYEAHANKVGTTVGPQPKPTPPPAPTPPKPPEPKPTVEPTPPPEPPKPSGNNPNPMGGVRTGGVSKVDTKTGITYTYHEDNKGFEDHSVYVQAHKDGQVLGDTFAHPRYGHLNVNGPAVSVWKYQVAEDGRRQGVAKQMIQTIHENNPGAKITHSGFVSPEGEKFADSLDPKFNRIMPTGETRFRPTKGTPKPPAPSVSKPEPIKPFVYDDTKSVDQNHSDLTAHIRKSLKAQGVNAKVTKHQGGSTGRTVHVDMVTAKGNEFSPRDQRKILQTGKDNGLTHVQGMEIDPEGPATHPSGTTFYLGYDKPKPASIPRGQNPKVEDIVDGQPINHPDGGFMRVVTNKKLAAGGHIVTVKSDGGETSMAHYPNDLASDVAAKHLARLAERDREANPPPEPEPGSVAPGNHYNVGSGEHDAYNAGYARADKSITPEMDQAEAERQVFKEVAAAEEIGRARIADISGPGNSQAAREAEAEHQGATERFRDHLEEQKVKAIRLTNTYPEGSPEQHAFETGRSYGKAAAQVDQLHSGQAREKAKQVRASSINESTPRNRAAEEGKAAGYEDHAADMEKIEEPIAPEAREHALNLFAKTDAFQAQHVNGALAGAIAHVQAGTPTRQKVGLDAIDKAEQSRNASRMQMGMVPDDAIHDEFEDMRNQVRKSKPGENITVPKVSTKSSHTKTVDLVNSQMTGVDNNNERAPEALKAMEFHSQLAHAVATGSESPPPPDIRGYKHGASGGYTSKDSYTPEHVAEMRKSMEDVVSDPDAPIATFGGTTVRDLQSHAALMAKGNEIASRIDSDPLVASNRAAYDRAKENVEQEKVKRDAALAVLGPRPQRMDFGTKEEGTLASGDAYTFPRLTDEQRQAYYAAVAEWEGKQKDISQPLELAQMDADSLSAAFKDNMRNATIKELAKEREFGGGAANYPITAKDAHGRLDPAVAKVEKPAKLVRDTLTAYPTDWLKTGAARGGVSINTNEKYGRKGKATGRASYTQSYNRLNIAKAETHTTTIHELGHHMQEQLPELSRMEQAHVVSRTAGDRIHSMASLQPMHRYGPNEVTYEDEFVDPYVGKDYSGQTPGGVPAKSAHEVFTVGVQSVLGKTSKKNASSSREVFGRLVGVDGQVADPRLRSFVLGALATVGKPKQ